MIKGADGEYRLAKDARPIVAREAPATCPLCGGKELIQDPDVLDTWFSSGLWPFSTLGWPDQTEDLKTFYPTSALVTGFDILFFWVARMIMMGLKFMGDVPFRDVYIHALVRDEQGQKMSKSKGNVIDPLEIMSQCGTDAFRFTLAAMAAMGRDIKLAEDRIAGYQNFVNKLWNAARFVQMNLGGANGTGDHTSSVLDDRHLGFAERWIRSRLAFAITESRNAIEAYRFNDYANVLYQFTWHEFCDWYIEMSKLALNGTDARVAARSRKLLQELLDQILLLLHPVMPFVTEEIWQVLGDNRKSIMVQPYPDAQASWIDEETEKQMKFLMGVIRAIRNLRTEMNCPPGKEVSVIFCGQRRRSRLSTRARSILTLACAGRRVGVSSSWRSPKGSGDRGGWSDGNLFAIGRSRQSRRGAGEAGERSGQDRRRAGASAKETRQCRLPRQSQARSDSQRSGKRRASSRKRFARLETAWRKFRKSKREGIEPMDIHVSPQIERLIRDSLDEDIGAGDLATMATDLGGIARHGVISRQKRWSRGRFGFARPNFLFHRS